MSGITIIVICIAFMIPAIILTIVGIINKDYKELEEQVLKELRMPHWNIIPYYDASVLVKSRTTLDKYDDIMFFKENRESLAVAKTKLGYKIEIATVLINFLSINKYKEHARYKRLEKQILTVINSAKAYRIYVDYISSAGNHLGNKTISLSMYDLTRFEENPSLLMSKGEYNKYIKEQQKEALAQKQHTFYGSINNIIDYANASRDILVIKGSQEQMDNLITQLVDTTLNRVAKIKTADSEEWQIINALIAPLEEEVKKIVSKNQKILEYYESNEFLKIKETCEVLMSTQREFNEYITEKVNSISDLFGTRVIRSETLNEDVYQYIRPYKKTITPFTAEVSNTVFASAENSPLEYVVKNFYPDKKLYPEQIQKLHLLVGELATLREARQIIENYKVEYQQYLGDVPDYVMNNDESGFYSRLGFANIDESILVVEYKFSYTSGGGMAKRTFTVPMTEATIVELIKILESKLTIHAFTREQRALMTAKLRESIKTRDNFTCCNCGNSTHSEPNLLLEIDHIIPVSKGGCTVEENLQTLCWKCNRAKSNKVVKYEN